MMSFKEALKSVIPKTESFIFEKIRVYWIKLLLLRLYGKNIIYLGSNLITESLKAQIILSTVLFQLRNWCTRG